MSFLRPAPSTPVPTAPTGDAPPAAQYAALCYRKAKGKVEVLLVTSRDTGRWVLPKGWPIKGLAPPQAAAREAFEEAGIEGAVSNLSVGQFSYLKRMTTGEDLPCIVAVYALKTARQLDEFPEKGQRQRKWFRPQKAALRVQEPDLQVLLAGFSPPDA